MLRVKGKGNDAMKIYIRGFAELQREVERKLSTHTDEIIEHIIKLILMPKNSARNHWQSEIAGQIRTIDKLKSSKKFPTAKQIYNWTYGKKQDLVTDVGWMGVSIDEIEYQYKITNELSVKKVCDMVDSACFEYFKWLSTELSRVGKVSTPDIYKKLDSLL